MNTDTGQVKPWDELSEAEKKDPKWVKLPKDMTEQQIRKLSRSDVKRREYMAKVYEKKRSGENV